MVEGERLTRFVCEPRLLIEEITIVRMDPVEQYLPGRLLGLANLQDGIELFRPLRSIGFDVPAPATYACHLLGLGQLGFALTKSLFGSMPDGDIPDDGEDRFGVIGIEGFEGDFE